MRCTKRSARALQCTGRELLPKLNAGNSSTAQRQRLLTALHRDSVTTFQARHTLDVPHPAGRVQELRRAGHHIITQWCDDLSTAGRKHRVARYVLKAGAP